MPAIPAVAIITRTKNRPRLLERAIASVLDQTFTDFCLIIVNDGGEPREVDEVVANHQEMFQGRIKVVHHHASLGMEAASNAGIRASESRFIALLDDDDTWDPRFLELTVQTMERTGSMGVVTDTTVVIETTEGGELRRRECFEFDPRPGPWMVPRPPTDLFRLMSWNQFPPCAFVYRREALKDIGFYDESLPVLGDWDFNLRFFLRYRCEHVERVLAQYHHRPASDDALGNSVHGAEEVHERVRLELLERYLRQDLREGRVGVGAFSNLLYDMRQGRIAAAAAHGELVEKLATMQASLDEVRGRIEVLAALVESKCVDAVELREPEKSKSLVLGLRRSLYSGIALVRRAMFHR